MRISLTTDAGEVLEIIGAEEIGNLEKQMACDVLMDSIRRAWRRDRDASKHPAAQAVRMRRRGE